MLTTGWFATHTSDVSVNLRYPITTGMSYNRSLWRATGAHIGAEARALMNGGESYSTFWAPVINLARDVRRRRIRLRPPADFVKYNNAVDRFVKEPSISIKSVRMMCAQRLSAYYSYSMN